MTVSTRPARCSLIAALALCGMLTLAVTVAASNDDAEALFAETFDATSGGTPVASVA